MKKLFALLAFVSLSALFTACTEEEVKPQTDSASGKTETNNSKWD